MPYADEVAERAGGLRCRNVEFFARLAAIRSGTGNGNDKVRLGTRPYNVVTLGVGEGTVTVSVTGTHGTINAGNEAVYLGTGKRNTYYGAANHTDVCHVPAPRILWRGAAAACYYHSTLTGCTVVPP
jgi:hypothetical protein